MTESRDSQEVTAPLVVPMNDLARRWAPFAGDLERLSEEFVRGGRAILGPQVEGFERDFAGYCGVEHCVGVAKRTRGRKVHPGYRSANETLAAVSNCDVESIATHAHLRLDLSPRAPPIGDLAERRRPYPAIGGDRSRHPRERRHQSWRGEELRVS